jgi:Ca2+-binding RTX toxin-like protein
MMATFAGDTIDPMRFNGFNRSGDSDAVLYNNSDVGVTVEGSGGSVKGSDLYGDSYGNTMFAIEQLEGSDFSDTFRVGYDLSKGVGATTAGGTIFERSFFLHLSLRDGNNLVTITSGLPDREFFDAAYLEIGGFDSFDGAVIGTGQGNDTINGGSLRDLINSGAGDDKIRGGGGDDIITTGGGVDIVWGGTGDDNITVSAISDLGSSTISGDEGRDTIVLSSTFDVVDFVRIDRLSDSSGTEMDSIHFFNAREDLISIAQIDANGRRPGDGEFRLVTDFTGRRGELQYDYKANGSFPLWKFTGDVDGDGVADFGLTLVSPIGLPANSSLVSMSEFFDL